MAIDNLLSGPQKDALAALNSLFTSYGIGSLAPKITEFLQNGYSADTIGLLLKETPDASSSAHVMSSSRRGFASSCPYALLACSASP